jgi:hypothetical protein
MWSIKVKRSKADVCLFYQWTSIGLLVCMSWVDIILIAGKKEAVAQVKSSLKRHFTLDEQWGSLLSTSDAELSGV